jgi:prepilin-type N-terminal cleavage/methylation domain-containing protein
MNCIAYRKQSGFSILELLMVIVVVTILATIGIVIFRGAKTDFERQRIVREFKIYLERARFDSVKRRATTAAQMSKIVLNGPFSFTAHLDFNNDGALSPDEERLVDFTSRSSTRIVVSDTLNYPVTILFDRRGHVDSRDAASIPVEPLFTICSECSSANPQTTVLSLSTTGTVAVIRNGVLPSAMPTPAITNTSPILNCYVLVVANSGCE